MVHKNSMLEVLRVLLKNAKMKVKRVLHCAPLLWKCSKLEVMPDA